MDKIIHTIEKALEDKNYYSGMYVVLALVGTCSRKQYPDRKLRDCEVYTTWIDKYHTAHSKKLYNNNFIPAISLYQLRCSILHESSTILKTDKDNDIRKFIMTQADSHFNFDPASGITQVNARKFITELLDSIKLWKTDAEKNNINTICDFDILNGKWSTQDIDGACGFKDCF